MGTLHKSTIHENSRFKVEHWKKEDEQSTYENYFVIKPDAAAVIVFTLTHVLVTEHYRVIPDDWLLEIPGGRIEVGESPEAAAKRELLEETSIQVSELSIYWRGHTMASLTTEILYVFEAQIEQLAPISPCDGETHLRPIWLTFAEAIERIERQPFSLDALILLSWLKRAK